MGIERTIRFATGTIPDWSGIADRLSTSGQPAIIRMIDGLPAFPDEIPPADWRELRISLAGGMITLRRGPTTIQCVTWGTTDAALEAARDAVCRAVAEAGGGEIVPPS